MANKIIAFLCTFGLFINLNAQIETEQWYYLINENSGLYADVPGGTSENATPLWQYGSNCTAAQKWKFEDAGDGYYYIVSQVSGLVMDVKGGGEAPGTIIWQYNKNGTDAQKWALEKIEVETYRIKSKRNGLYLEIQAQSKDQNAGFWVNNLNTNTKAQQWKIHAVTDLEKVSNISSIDYLGNYPDETNPGWEKDIQGITHDDGNWFISQTEKLWRIPVYHDLNKGFLKWVHQKQRWVSDIPAYVSFVHLPAELKNQGYNHFGDLDYYKGFLFIPVTTSKDASGNQNPVIAIFNASSLAYVSALDISNYIPEASWCAIDSHNGHLYTSTFNHLTPLHQFKIDITGNEISLTLSEIITDFKGNNCANVDITRMQGGCFSPNGDYLFLLTGFHSGHESKEGGIWIMDMKKREMVAKSYSQFVRPIPNTNPTQYERVPDRKLSPFNKNFLYEFHPNYSKYEEPEGITFWDLDNSDVRAPGIQGQLHALLLDNDEWGAGFPSWDDIYIKHYRLGPVDEFHEAPADIDWRPSAVHDDRSFQPDLIAGLCPRQIGGDKEFAGHGPVVTASCALGISTNKRTVEAVLRLHVKETKKDWTEAEGVWVRDLWTAPAGYTIDRILSGTTSLKSYTDDDTDLDRWPIGGDGPVREFAIMGDTRGNDIGNCTKGDVYMDVYFKRIRVRLKKDPLKVK